MNTKECPPPYSDLASASQTPGTGYASPSSPTFEPPYMNRQPQPAPMTTVTSINLGQGTFIPGSCPVCHNRSWTGTYGCCAWCLCILLFPVGIICCLCMRKKKCTKCGFTPS